MRGGGLAPTTPSNSWPRPGLVRIVGLPGRCATPLGFGALTASPRVTYAAPPFNTNVRAVERSSRRVHVAKNSRCRMTRRESCSNATQRNAAPLTELQETWRNASLGRPRVKTESIIPPRAPDLPWRRPRKRGDSRHATCSSMRVAAVVSLEQKLDDDLAEDDDSTEANHFEGRVFGGTYRILSRLSDRARWLSSSKPSTSASTARSRSRCSTRGASTTPTYGFASRRKRNSSAGSRIATS